MHPHGVRMQMRRRNRIGRPSPIAERLSLGLGGRDGLQAGGRNGLQASGRDGLHASGRDGFVRDRVEVTVYLSSEAQGDTSVVELAAAPDIDGCPLRYVDVDVVVVHACAVRFGAGRRAQAVRLVRSPWP